MAGMGPAPKNPAERARRAAPTAGEWVLLDPSPRSESAPVLPEGREWSPATLTAWEALWRKPQARLWDPSGETLHRWAWLHADLIDRRGSTTSISSEMRQLEDRHGLSPRALMTLRWRIGDPEQAPTPSRPRQPASRRARLKVVDPKGR